jgi:hypothetical protein
MCPLLSHKVRRGVSTVTLDLNGVQGGRGINAIALDSRMVGGSFVALIPAGAGE